MRHPPRSSGASSPSAAEVAEARFTLVRRHGYDQTSVDDLLDRVVDALRTREPAAAPLTATGLATWTLPGAPLLSLGYVREDVDALLRRAASALRHRGASGPGLTAEAVRASHLPTTRRGGYSVAEVDDLLDRLAADLEAGPRG